MSMRRIARHTWLFSFTDIAFLLLLVYTQLARMSSSENPVAEMRLPAPIVAKNPELTIMKANQDYHQLLVEKHSDRPYRLAHIIGGNEISRSAAMSFEQLGAALRLILGDRKNAPRPVVVPLPESFSSDLLQAAALVSKNWNEAGTAVVHTDRNEGKP
jgi:hypothetical protein